MMGTVAKQDREKEGLWEVEVSYGGEVDLHRHHAGCKKNPGHLNFVPVDQFHVHSLPPGYQDEDLVKLVRVRSDLTVLVSVKYVSERRPKNFPGSDTPYPFYKERRRTMLRTGTGLVDKVIILPIETDNTKRIYQCNECRNSPTPKAQHATIHICTAAHVVFDNQEGAHTTCHLFFDNGGTPDARKGVIALNDMICMAIPSSDSSSLLYLTHDLDLAHRLLKMVDDQSVLMHKVKRMYSKMYSHPTRKNEHDSSRVFEDLNYLTIIVSHPHGCSKQISVGRCVTRDLKFNERGDELSMYTYTTPTCRGSSGASILILGPEWLNMPSHHAHGGQCEENEQLNYCCYAENVNLSQVKDQAGLLAVIKEMTVNYELLQQQITEAHERGIILQAISQSFRLLSRDDQEKQGPAEVNVEDGADRQRQTDAGEKNSDDPERVSVDQINTDHNPPRFSKAITDTAVAMMDIIVDMAQQQIRENGLTFPSSDNSEGKDEEATP